MNRRQILAATVAGAAPALFGCATASNVARHEPYRLGRLLHSDDFHDGLGQWLVEAERTSSVSAKSGVLDIDAPAGLTAWFRPRLEGPVSIAYEATPVAAGGPHDEVSDLNAFWMATDPRSPGDLLAKPRSGAFADYDLLATYYVGHGGNRNTTTRFRRYIGKAGDRPILPQHDLSAREYMLSPNTGVAVQLIAYGGLIQYWADGRKLFELNDPQPYTAGWFGVRTTKNHLQVSRLRIHALEAR